MTKTHQEAREHSIISGYAAVIKREGEKAFYTDSDEILQATRTEDFRAEYFKCEKVTA